MKTLKQVLSLTLVLTSLWGIQTSPLTNKSLAFSKTVKVAVLGDNYPHKWQKGWGADSWGMYLRQCTSFVAFRLSTTNGFNLPAGYGNADSWGHIAKAQGFLVNQIPQVGAVAWFDKGVNYSHRDYGHVAWVAEVSGDYVTLEEYNYNAGQGPEKYHRRQIHRQQVSGFIHFKDITTEQSTIPSSNHILAESTKLLPNKGTYYFKAMSPVKEEARFQSLTLTSYSAGQYVHYDQTMVADGYQWISYIGFSGNRRYIPVVKMEERKSESPETPKSERIFKVGDTVSFQGTFKVTQIHGNLVSSADLAGGQPSQLNWIDPGPVDKTNASGQKEANQILSPDNYFTIPGTYKVLQVDLPSRGLYIQIGSRASWVTMDRVLKQ
ncbi:SH3 domain-containing protein [Streptococcus iniae]|uniref:CHAP domain-containing protein n=1 Tax=Streptococcus iniae TaxID=1346 RepID=UPI002B2BEC51|nr:SH3 domain-containing protein [Streptococcus iniae]WNZ97262.1 SH3 domain-containing protein [Streptococcus iniae]